MMRQGHWLRGNWSTQIPKRHFCLATSLEDHKGKAGCGALKNFCIRACRWEVAGLVIDEEWCDETPASAWSFIGEYLDKKSAAIVWLACPREDLPALHFQTLVAEGLFDRRYWVWGDPPIIVAGNLSGGKVKLLGIQNWLDHWKPAPEHAIGKCSQLHAAVENILRFVHREDLGHLRSTVAGQSFQAYRHLSLPGKIGIHCNRAALALERSLPLGHPVRQFAYGKTPGPIFVLDVNSLFPYVQGNYPYPRKLLWHTEQITPEELARATVHELVIARVTGYAKGERYLVQRQSGAAFVDCWDKDVLCGSDLDRAFATGHVSHVWEACSYDGAGIFSKWSDWANLLRDKYRQHGTATEYGVAKALTTRLWSQFAQRLNRWVPYPDCGPVATDYGEFWDHPQPGVDYFCRAIAGVIDRMESLEEPDDSFPAISGFVAAYARDYVRRLCDLAGWENIHYVVADAIHVSFEGYTRLLEFGVIHPTRPGALKVSKEVKDATYLAANCHVMDGTLTQAGRPIFAREGPTGTWSWYSARPLSTEILRPPDGAVHSEWHHVSTPEPVMTSGEKYLPD